jgi:hypothetical protein
MGIQYHQITEASLSLDKATIVQRGGDGKIEVLVDELTERDLN